MNGRGRLAATSHPKREIRFAPRVGGRRPCLRSLKASRITSPWRQFRLVPAYGVRRFCRACAIKRMARAVSGVLPQRQGDRHARAQSVGGGSSASRAGPAVSTLGGKVSGLRRHRLGRFADEAAMTNMGPLADRRALHFPACVRGVMALGQAAFRAAAHDAIDADPQGSRERR